MISQQQIDKQYFRENQKLLLSLVNNDIGRRFLKIDNDLPIIHLLPHAVFQLKGYKGKRPIIQAHFFESDFVADKLMPIITQMDIVDTFQKIDDNYEAFLHFSGIRQSRKYPQLYLTTSTFNPNAGGSGRVIGTFVGTWSAARGATTGAATDTLHIIYTTFSSPNYRTDRTYYSFDTSAIGGGQTIQSAFIKLLRDDSIGGVAMLTNDSTTVEITQSTQASATALATTDLGNVLFTSTGNFTMSGTTNLTYSQVNFNATGLGWINTGGFTKLAGLSGLDQGNTAPTGTNQIAFQNSANANPPVLSVTFVLAPTGSNLSLLGVG